MANNTRRTFLKQSVAAAGLTIVPRHVLGRGFIPPSDKVTLGCIGIGAQGTRVMLDFLKEPDVQVTAVCDVNRGSDNYVEWGKGELNQKVAEAIGSSNWGANSPGGIAGRDPARQVVDGYYSKNGGTTSKGCAAYTDFRELLAKQADLDAVMICTPDHWHAPIAIAAMRAKKHVYCQKPMAHSVHEARRMAEVARETGVATQVAVTNSASEDTRLLQEWIGAGVIGSVRRVQNWSTRPFWPQGIERPQTAESVPDGLDWDLWLGPAPQRPYNHEYLPFVWRGWYDFGCGALGDMGQYSFDTIFRALKLDNVESVEASSTKRMPETFPAASLVEFHFAPRAQMPPVTIEWFDGELRPERPPELDDSRDLSGEDNEGLLFIGDGGKILCGFHGQNPQLLPASRMQSFHPPAKTLPRSPGHYREFVGACKGGPKPAANFEFSAPIVEALLLGNIAVRTGKLLRWNAAKFAITNAPEAQQFVNPPHRGTWAT